MTKPLLKGNMGAHHYQRKPELEDEVKAQKIVRACLRCGCIFTAPTRFIRLCGCSVTR